MSEYKPKWLAQFSEQSLDDLCYKRNAAYRAAVCKAKWAFVHNILINYLQDRYWKDIHTTEPYSEEWKKAMNKMTVAECGIKFATLEDDEELPAEDILCNQYYRDEMLFESQIDSWHGPDAWYTELALSMAAWFMMSMINPAIIENIKI